MKPSISSIFNEKTLHLYFLEQKKLFTLLEKYVFSETKILLGVSGGPDSMFCAYVVYDFFMKKEYSLDNFFVIHCHHGVRKESDKELQFVSDFFAILGENFIIKKYTGNEIKEQDLRQRRFVQFDCAMQKIDASYLILGHNLSDRVESSLLHLLRGAGLQGFLSMRMCENHHLLHQGKILRPLLSITKPRIKSLCKEYAIPFVDDISNSDSSVSKRNYLRNKILPQLFELSHKNDHQENTFLKSMGQLYSDLEMFVPLDIQDLLISIILCKYWNADRGYQLKISSQKLTNTILVSLLRYLGVAQNITKKNINDIVNFLCNKASGYKYLNGVYFFVSHKKLYLIKAKKMFWEQNITLSIEVSSNESVTFDNYALSVPAISTKGQIRYPQGGDVFQCKNRNKWCINHKVPVFWRKFIPVLVVNDKLEIVFDQVWKG